MLLPCYLCDTELTECVLDGSCAGNRATNSCGACPVSNLSTLFSWGKLVPTSITLDQNKYLKQMLVICGSKCSASHHTYLIPTYYCIQLMWFMRMLWQLMFVFWNCILWIRFLICFTFTCFYLLQNPFHAFFCVCVCSTDLLTCILLNIIAYNYNIQHTRNARFVVNLKDQKQDLNSPGWKWLMKELITPLYLWFTSYSFLSSYKRSERILLLSAGHRMAQQNIKSSNTVWKARSYCCYL